MANCPTPFLRQAEYFARWGVLVSRIVPQRDVRVLEAEECQVLLLVQRSQAEDLPVERLRALKVSDYQIDGKDLLLPFSHLRLPQLASPVDVVLRTGPLGDRKPIGRAW